MLPDGQTGRRWCVVRMDAPNGVTPLGVGYFGRSRILTLTFPIRTVLVGIWPLTSFLTGLPTPPRLPIARQTEGEAA
jgi:hypothetical protein